MAISGVNPKCYILALFVRDDGARFLLGDDPFEFKDNQLHFQQNTMANDVVEVQGNDGYLLAGQVRRPGTQMFDGYVCNGTNSKEEVEVQRRAFLQFFRRSHFYKVIYVFPNGTAIQRKQGFLVDDPTVQELYQQYPEYHVALNFEDVNYYTYEEDDQGHEIYAKEAIVPLARGGATGGLIWDNYGVVWEDAWSLPLSISGVQFQILNNAGARAPIDNVELYGDTYQQTYSGKNLLPSNPVGSTTSHAVTLTVDETGRITVNGTADANVYFNLNKVTLAAGSYMLSGLPFGGSSSSFRIAFNFGGTVQNLFSVNGRAFTLDNTYTATEAFLFIANGYTANNLVFEPMIESGSTKTSYEPYTGGIPAPNPDYPQAVQVVTGEQTVTISDGVNSHDYPISLTGKNLFNKNNSPIYLANGATASSLANGVRVTNSGGSQWGSVFYKVLNTADYIGKTITARAIISVSGTNKPRMGFTLCAPDGSNRQGIPGYVTSTGEQTISYTIESEDASRPILALTVYANYEGTLTNTLYADYTELQVEVGSATPYAPYYNYELCKIGDYQDYIYKSGDDWYVHKDTGKQIIDTNSITLKDTYSNIEYGAFDKPSDYIENGNLVSEVGTLLCSHATPMPADSWNTVRNIGGIFGSAQRAFSWVGFPKGTGLDAIKTKLTGAFSYYVLVTPTDTKITDATLVGQLNALDAMKLFIGENNLLVSATASNLPATLAFDYYTQFASIGAEWEEGGTKGATIVDVDAIDNTYPVWELTGPATNPTLSVLTTNTALTYNGTITASQKLVIDMFNKTATLNGTSVIGNISGDFVYMAPGTNRLAYTAGNTDAPDSTIYWQEVVG